MDKSIHKIVCPDCNNLVETVVLGNESYTEFECPHCSSWVWAKSKKGCVKTGRKARPHIIIDKSIRTSI